MMWKGFVLSLLLGFGGVPVAHAEQLAADALVRQEAAALFEAIDRYREQGPEALEAFYGEVQQRMDAFVDYDAIAQGVMGAYFASATPEQRSRFARNFGKRWVANMQRRSWRSSLRPMQCSPPGPKPCPRASDRQW